MRVQGTESDKQFIDYDSLPLMRQLFCWNFSFCLSFVLLLIAQVLFYMWFIHSQIGMWHAIFPVSILCIGFLTYLYVVNAVSLSEVFCISLLAIQLVSLFI